MASVSSLDKDISRLRLGKYNPQAVQEVKDWLSTTLGEKLGNGELMDILKDGVLLCRLANLLEPKPLIRFKTSAMPFVQMENISHFLRFSSQPPISLPPHDLFLTIDLYEQKDPAQVLQCLSAFSRVATKLNPSVFPTTIGGVRGGGGGASTLQPTAARSWGKNKKDAPSSSSGGGGVSSASGYSTSLNTPTGPPTFFGKPTAPPRKQMSSWIKPTDEGNTAPAWNVAQYGYMGGASQGNQGISFGSRRQIIASPASQAATSPPPPPPAAQPQIDQKREDEELQIRLREQQMEDRRRQEEGERIQREQEMMRRHEEEKRRLRLEEEAEEKRVLEAENKRWLEEEARKRWEKEEEMAAMEADRRRWKEEDDRRRHWQAEQDQHREAEREREQEVKLATEKKEEEATRIRDAEAQRRLESEKRERERERERIRELERELEKARERERLYEAEKEERRRQDTERMRWEAREVMRHRTDEHPLNRHWPGETETISTIERDSGIVIRHKTGDYDREDLETERHFLQNSWREQGVSTPPPTGPLHAQKPLSSPKPQPRALPTPPPRKLPSTPGNTASGVPPNTFFTSQDHQRRESWETNDDSTGLERQEHERETDRERKEAYKWASMSLLERERERERERQREWEANQREVEQHHSEQLDDDHDEGSAWDVNQYGYMGGANQGTMGVAFGARRQIIGPRSPREGTSR